MTRAHPVEPDGLTLGGLRRGALRPTDWKPTLSAMRDLDTIDSELRLLLAIP